MRSIFPAEEQPLPAADYPSSVTRVILGDDLVGAIQEIARPPRVGSTRVIVLAHRGKIVTLTPFQGILLSDYGHAQQSEIVELRGRLDQRRQTMIEMQMTSRGLYGSAKPELPGWRPVAVLRREADKIERYVGGMTDPIYSSVVASKPKTMQEAIEMATGLMDRRINTLAENKRG
ncbi:hypothetical protein Tco_1329551 [Tanacetum coccineum]